MEWYEIVSMFIFVCGAVGSLGFIAFWEYKRILEDIRLLKKEHQFYDIAGEWFNNQLNK